MNAIVSVTTNWGIGHKGKLLVRNRDDMRFFREKTMGGTVVCGRTTFQSFPGGPLKGRRNVVLTQNLDYDPDGVDVVHNLDELHGAIAHDDPNKVWIIGGEKVYRQLIDECDRAYVTVHEALRDADAFFPNLDENPSWTIEETSSPAVTAEGISYRFVTYAQV